MRDDNRDRLRELVLPYAKKRDRVRAEDICENMINRDKEQIIEYLQDWESFKEELDNAIS